MYLIIALDVEQVSRFHDVHTLMLLCILVNIISNGNVDGMVDGDKNKPFLDEPLNFILCKNSFG